MLFVIIHWFILGIITYPIGYILLSFIKSASHIEKHAVLSILTGFVFVTTYAQILSLFVPLGNITVFVLLALISTFCIFFCRKKIFQNIRECFHRNTIVDYLFIVVATISISYFTSVGLFFLDTDAYHAQAIRWCEEYRAIKGLGNLSRNLAYNSAFFPLTALFGLKPVFHQSMHTIQGLLALLVLIKTKGVVRQFYKHQIHVSDFVKLAAFYYISLCLVYLPSPSSDYASMMPIFIVIIYWLEWLEEEEQHTPAEFAPLCMILCMCVTFKLSVVPMLLLSLYPAVYFVKKGYVKKLWGYIAKALLIIVPYLVRNMILSGWLLYPSTLFGFIKVPWQMEKQIAQADAFQIKVWGWGVHYDNELASSSMLNWVLIWFNTVLSATEKALVLLCIGATILTLICCIISLCKKHTISPTLFVSVVLCVSYLFWQYSAPLPRYGYAYILILPATTLGLVMASLQKKLEGYPRTAVCFSMFLFVVTILFVLWKSVPALLRFGEGNMPAALFKQIDYSYADDSIPEENIIELALDDYTFYYLKNSQQPGYHSLPVGRLTFGPLGDNTVDGFYYNPHREEEIPELNQ